VADLDRLLRALVCPETVCFIEDPPMYRGRMNLRSTAVLFRNFGRIEGVLASLKCRVEYLKPDWWQKALRLGKSADHGDRWKAHLKARAQALFPRVEADKMKLADWNVRFTLARILSSALREELERFTDFELLFVEGPQGSQVAVVTHQMAGASVDGAQQKHHVVRIDGIMAEVEKSYGDQFCVNREGREECLHLWGGHSMRQQLLCVLGKSIKTDKQLELSLLPAV